MKNAVNKEVIRRFESFIEIGLLTLMFGYVWKFCYRALSLMPYYGRGKYVICGMYGFILFLMFFSMDCYKFGYLKILDLSILQSMVLFVSNFIAYCLLCLLSNKMVPVVPLLQLTALQILFAVIFSFICTKIFSASFSPRHMLMVCGSEQAYNLKDKIGSRPDKYRIDKVILSDEGLNVICDEVKKYDTVLINDIPAELRNDLVKFCYANNIRTYVTPKISDIILKKSYDITLVDSPLFLMKNTDSSVFQLALKRFADIFICTLMLVVLSPLMLAVAVAIKCEDGGPVFFRQVRITKGGKNFRILKFRSMIVNAEKNGEVIRATEHDKRITRVGRLIRSCRIDELPQLINIIKGDMSIVGPRPERPELAEKYCNEIPEFVLRTKVRGGLTGLAQVYGKYNTVPYDKLRLDLAYIENFSILLDVKLILMTVAVLFKKESTEGFK